MNARSLAITRAVAVIGGTGALIAAATFAAVTTNPVTISGINLASSDVNVLQVFDFGSGNFATDTSNPSVNGQNIDLALTTTDSAKQPFYLKNNDTHALTISVRASQNGTGSLDPNNVEVTFWDDSATPAQVGQATLASLESGSTTFTSGGDLQAGAQGNSSDRGSGHNGNYNVSFSLVNSATSFDSLSGVQLEFTGTPQIL